MSRPNTRSKNKRNRNDDISDSSSELLRKIHLTGEISQTDISKLYLLWKPVCNGCRVNTKDSPNCFCGLIPPSNGTRKTGLWQRMSDIITSIGTNPCKDLRPSTDTPAGLTNLGATCYANSILQCLYMNTSFRAGIFSVEPDLLKQHPVLDQLVRLFAQLHLSKMAFIDSAPFINTLELDNGVQQDTHEFLTLFLSLLERSLKHSQVFNARTVVQDLFCGSVSHVTRCSVCGKDSDASSNVEDFYELELNIKGLNNLEESLNDYLNVEELRGENQYFCESCGKRVDATRCIKLRSLPSVLNFQLKRYVFIPKTTTKKKITSEFSFPRQLNMEKRLFSPSASGLVYELSAILIHKGSAVNSGHYVAHIRDENSGQWWEFDDEHVSMLGCHPFGEGSSNSFMKSEPNSQVDHSKQGQPIVNGNNIHILQPPKSGQNVSFPEEMYSSTDAYMLMYNRKNISDNGNGSHRIYAPNVDENSSLPLDFAEEIRELNASYVTACEEYQLRKDRQVTYITERRQEVRTILSEAPVYTLEEPYFWVSADWLRQWSDGINPTPLDNSPLQCIHGKVPVSKITSMKRLSSTAWNKLYDKYGGGPALTHDDYCIECLKDGARNTVNADDYRGQRTSMRHLAEASLSGHCSDGALYYLSRSWLVQWLRRKNVDFPSEADAGPTASLRCCHGGLLPEKASGAKRVLVPENLWLFFYESANAVKPNDLLGSSVFPSDCETCEICNKELTEVASMEESLRVAKLQQRQNHEKLIQGKNFTLYRGAKYFLVPSAWLAKWRAYVASTGKNITSSAEPESLQVIMDSLICQKHLRLLQRPLELVYKRGVLTQKLSTADGLTIIPESDWKLFCEEWNIDEKQGISAEIAFTNNGTSRLTGSHEEILIIESDMEHSNNEKSDDLEAGKPFIRTHPEICEDCIGERESCELIRKLNYFDEDICVYLVHGKEAPRSILEASSAVSEPDRRTSKRSRKTSFGNSVNLKVSGSTSVYQLKMMIWEAFGVVKENQKLHKGSVEIEGDFDTLADKNICPGDVLWVKDSEIHENRDIADEILEQKIEPQKAEEGFRGTLLTADASVQEMYDRGALT